MLPPVVLIDVQPELEPARAQVLADRCTEVVASQGSGGCATQPALPPGGEQNNAGETWRVRIQWSGLPVQSAEVALFEAADPWVALRRQRVDFPESAPEADRWDSIGLLVAALVVSAREERSAATAASTNPAPATEEPPPSETQAPPASWRGHVGAAAWLGSALNGGDPLFGAALLAQLGLPELPLRPLLLGGYGHVGGELSFDVGFLSLGSGVVLLGAPVDLEVQAALTGQFLHATASRAARTESADSARLGGSLGLAAFPQIAGAWSAWLSAEATLMSPELQLTVEDRSAGAVGPLGWRGFLGLRWSP